MLQGTSLTQVFTLAESNSPVDTVLYRFNLCALDEIYFRTFSGSFWRSLFGMSLRRIVCVTQQPDCHQCMLSANCAYSYLFETAPPADANRMRRYTTIPHPFVIKNTPSEKKLCKGQIFDFEMVLIGKGNEYLPYIMQSLIRAGMLGIHREKSKFTLQTVSCQLPGADQTWQTLWQKGQSQITKVQRMKTLIPCPPVQEQVTIHFKTPFRFIQQGKPLRPSKLAFHHLYRSLSRRIAMLAYFHNNIDLELNYKANIKKAEAVKIISGELHWTEWERYSARQKTVMKMGGITGEIVIDLLSYKDLWPMLWLGQYTHAGKATSMGLGEFKLELIEKNGKLANRVCNDKKVYSST